MAPRVFVLHASGLLILGPIGMTIVGVVWALGEAIARTRPFRPSRAFLLELASVVAATQSAGLAYVALGGTTGTFVWPWNAVPLAVAVTVYGLVAGGAEDLFALIASNPAKAGSHNRIGSETWHQLLAWTKRALRTWPAHIVVTALAAALIEVVNHGAWEILIVSAVPVYLAWKASTRNLSLVGVGATQRTIDSLEQGVAVVDRHGRVRSWNDALARITGCSTKDATGRMLAEILSGFAKSDLPRAIADVLASGRSQALAQVTLPLASGTRALHITVLPDESGVTLLWHDVTEQARAARAFKRDAERLALVAEGASDGLWAWDLGTNEFYASSRWRSMVGLPPKSGSGRRDEWLDRVHPDDVAPLKEALDAHLAGKTERFEHEHRIRREDGVYHWFYCRGVAVRSTERRPARIAGSLTDITDQALAQERIQAAALCDPLTGLSNRGIFIDRLGEALKTFTVDRTRQFAVLYLDLDRFKLVNDSLGHLVGDELLIAVSRRLESCLRPDDALARLGGDEFAILLNGLGDGSQANVVAHRIQDALGAPFSIGGREVFTTASIGIAFSRVEYTNPDEVMRDADTAMYHAKTHGKARHELFDADMHARALDRLGLENDLRHAVKSRALEVHYQPIVSLASGMCVGFESLIRWTRDGKPVSPADFIPVAEELGLIEPIGAWVLQEACRTFADWQVRHAQAGLECITVNVSARQLMQTGFVRLVEKAVEDARLRPSDLRLEITETALVDNPRRAAEVIREARDFGVKIYLDDFGTGYSSLSHLHKLPVDALKIDRSFVRSLLLSDRPAIVESILALARTLDTGVVAEGVESDLQARELERLGCRHAQGFYFSRPLPASAVEELLTARQPLGKHYAQSAAPGQRFPVAV